MTAPLPYLLAFALACLCGSGAALADAPANAGAAGVLTPAAPVPGAPAPAPQAGYAAQPVPGAATPAPAAPGAAGGKLVQTITALALVLGLLAALAWLMKRFTPRAPPGSPNLRIVGALNLGGRERIMVVEVGEQWIVVGASPGRMNALATMPKQQDSGAGAAPYPVPASSFAEWLKQTIDKRNAK